MLAHAAYVSTFLAPKKTSLDGKGKLRKLLHSKGKTWLPVWTHAGHLSAGNRRVIGKDSALLQNGINWKE